LLLALVGFLDLSHYISKEQDETVICKCTFLHLLMVSTSENVLH